jgi:hypothetical protein
LSGDDVTDAEFGGQSSQRRQAVADLEESGAKAVDQ